MTLDLFATIIDTTVQPSWHHNICMTDISLVSSFSSLSSLLALIPIWIIFKSKKKKKKKEEEEMTILESHIREYHFSLCKLFYLYIIEWCHTRYTISIEVYNHSNLNVHVS